MNFPSAPLCAVPASPPPLTCLFLHVTRSFRVGDVFEAARVSPWAEMHHIFLCSVSTNSMPCSSTCWPRFSKCILKGFSTAEYIESRWFFNLEHSDSYRKLSNHKITRDIYSKFDKLRSNLHFYHLGVLFLNYSLSHISFDLFSYIQSLICKWINCHAWGRTAMSSGPALTIYWGLDQMGYIVEPSLKVNTKKKITQTTIFFLHIIFKTGNIFPRNTM